MSGGYYVQLASTGLHSEMELLTFLKGEGSARSRIHEVGLVYPDGTMDSFYRGRKYLPRSEESIRISELRMINRLIGLPDSTPPSPQRIHRLSDRYGVTLP